jgi:hypothetical protein
MGPVFTKSVVLITCELESDTKRGVGRDMDLAHVLAPFECALVAEMHPVAVVLGF